MSETTRVDNVKTYGPYAVIAGLAYQLVSFGSCLLLLMVSADLSLNLFHLQSLNGGNK